MRNWEDTMKFSRRQFLHLANVVTTLSLFSWEQNVAANAAEIKVLCPVAIAPITDELFPQFERASGHKLSVRYGFGPTMKREIEAGEIFDVAILSLDVDDLIKQGKLAAGTRAVLGRTGIGVGVRQGAPKPDISTTEAFKRALLNAKSVAYSGGASGLYFLGLLDRLGISEDMKSKLKPQPDGGASPPRVVAKGEAEIAVTGVMIILMEPGAELIGSLPSQLQHYVIFTGGVSASAKQPEAGRALLNFLTTPSSFAVFKAKGLELLTP
jgi:molybdate transport system substrate-binding protein